MPVKGCPCRHVAGPHDRDSFNASPSCALLKCVSQSGWSRESQESLLFLGGDQNYKNIFFKLFSANVGETQEMRELDPTILSFFKDYPQWDLKIEQVLQKAPRVKCAGRDYLTLERRHPSMSTNIIQ
ncbi:hypothetical protein TNCV_3943161 [Trichonephila clavipes]|nr:hypothetical protein TNCV_2441141 [Trichonephila clavipes]GFS96513.1 hypothetical protein TNCV_3943161 [Trichonephila clavipes]